MKILKINDFPEKQIVEIGGIKYSYGLFRELGSFLPLNQSFKIIMRKDGIITVKREQK